MDLNAENGSIPIDLNLWPNDDLRGFFSSFDLVLNFGTTEHVSNQLNAFAILHYLSKPGGIMLQHVPMIHYSAHAMNVITPKFLEKLILNAPFLNSKPDTNDKLFKIRC